MYAIPLRSRTATGEHLDLEGRRIGWTHAKAVISALVTHEPEDA